ncbi:UNVERIFIED_CONTAM: hypothetical protein FKN15_056269 [Acipenser sinensis]
MTLCASFVRAGVTRLRHLINFELSCWLTATQLAGGLGWHSERLAEKMVSQLRSCLSPELREAVREEMSSGTGQRQDLIFPGLLVCPAVGEGEEDVGNEGMLLNLDTVKDLTLHTAERKKIYQMCVKASHSHQLRGVGGVKVEGMSGGKGGVQASMDGAV